MHLVSPSVDLSFRAFRCPLATIAILCALAQVSEGARVGYKYTGLVTNIGPSGNPPPFGTAVSNSTTVTGVFFYDTTLVGTQGSNSNTMNYPMYRSSGLTAKFIGPGATTVAISIDDYVVSVQNDVDQGNGSFKDIITFFFDSGSSSQPPGAFLIDKPSTAPYGSGYPYGQLRIALSANSTALSSPALPASINSTTFSSKIGFLADTPSGTTDPIDVLFVVTQPLVLIPEPATAALFALGAIALAGFRTRSKLFRR